MVFQIIVIKFRTQVRVGVDGDDVGRWRGEGGVAIFLYSHHGSQLVRQKQIGNQSGSQYIDKPIIHLVDDR